MNHLDDTIAAISTGRGNAGIAVIRISGPESISIIDEIFSGKIRLRDAVSHHAYLGRLLNSILDVESNKEITAFWDEVVVTVFRSPKSYTREDVVEVSCHGGEFLSHRILELLLKRGCRLAEPGEFTQRAFLNGRMDLTQAEAVSDIIRAKTDLSLQVALSQFHGVFSKRINDLRQQLLDICSLLELELDFSEEDVQFVDRSQIKTNLLKTSSDIMDFLGSYHRGKILRDGARLVIIGKPNVGKSSLMNALLKEDRAIVTDTPGTTRDVLEEQLSLGGLLFRVIDTAGVRETNDAVEREGVKRTIKQISDADVVLLMLDISEEFDEQDNKLFELVLKLRDTAESRNSILVVFNKIDLCKRKITEEVKGHLGNFPTMEISAKEMIGLDKLEKVLLKIATGKEHSILNTEPVVTNIRQKNALERALSAMNSAIQSLEQKISSEFIVLDVRSAMGCLSEIIGEVTTEDILGNIFSKFCIGK